MTLRGHTPQRARASTCLCGLRLSDLQTDEIFSLFHKAVGLKWLFVHRVAPAPPRSTKSSSPSSSLELIARRGAATEHPPMALHASSCRISVLFAALTFLVDVFLPWTSFAVLKKRDFISSSRCDVLAHTLSGTHTYRTCNTGRADTTLPLSVDLTKSITEHSTQQERRSVQQQEEDGSSLFGL